MINYFPLFLILYECSLYLSNDMYLPAFPSIMQEFGVEESVVQLTLSGWLLGDSIAQLIFGPLSDRVGRRPIIFGGGIVFILSCIGCAYVRNVNLFIILRFFQGASVCSVAVAGYAAIHESPDDIKAVKLIALMSMVSIWAPMLGPSAGGYVIVHHSWQTIFIMVAALTMIAMVGLYFVMPETLIAKTESSMSLANLISEYRGVIMNKQFIIYSIIFGLCFAGILGWISVAPFYLILQNDFTPEEFGYAQIPVFAGFIVGAQIMRICIERMALKMLVKLGLLIAFIGALSVLIVVLIDHHQAKLVIIGMSLYGVGFGTMASPTSRLAFNATDGGKGVVNAVYCSCLLLFGFIVTLIISAVGSDSLIVFAVIINLLTIGSLIGIDVKVK